jgi:hypothetical protein
VILLFTAVVAISLPGCDQPVDPTPVCTFTIAPATLSFPSAGGAGTVAVTASDASCAWTATAGASWITILEGASGTGSGSVNYNVAANSSTDARGGTITIGGQLHAVGQQGQAPVVCIYALSPAGVSIDREGGTGSIAVTAPDSCPWTATSNAAWLVVTSGAQGVGDGVVTYSIGRNDDVNPRGGGIAIADQIFGVTQSGYRAPACEYAVAPVQLNPCMPAGTLSTVITTQASCPWTAASSVPWLVLTTPESGSGTATIGFAFSANYDAARDGLLLVRWPSPTAGQNVRVSQAGCRYFVSQSAMSFTPAGGSGMFDVLQQSDPLECGGPTQGACVWTATSDVSWIVITTPMPRTGDNPVSFTVAANDSPSARTGTIRVRDQVVQISQAGR